MVDTTELLFQETVPRWYPKIYLNLQIKLVTQILVTTEFLVSKHPAGYRNESRKI